MGKFRYCGFEDLDGCQELCIVEGGIVTHSTKQLMIISISQPALLRSCDGCAKS